MSPLWRDEVSVFVGARRVALARMRRGLRPVRVAETSATVNCVGAGDWDATGHALDEQLAQPAWRDADARIVIGDHWARYAMVPWSSALRDESERKSHARHVLASVYGEPSGGWALAISSYARASARVVSAIPTGMLEDIRSMLDARRLRIVSMQPQLVAAYNRWRHRLPRCAAWFVSVDDGILAAAHVSEDGWDLVQSIRVRGDWSGDLNRLRRLRRLERGAAADGPVFVHAPPGLRAIACGTATDLEWLDAESESSANDTRRHLRGLYQ